MPVKNRQQWTVIAMMRVAQHSANQSDVGELCQPFRAAVSFKEDVLRFDEQPKLGGGIDALGNLPIHSMEAVEQQNLVLLKFYRLTGEAAAFFKTVNRLLDRFTIEQGLQVAVEQLNIQGFGRFVVAIVDPVCRMFHQRPKIVVEVEHEKTQPLFLQPFGQFYCRGCFSGRTWAADPHHAYSIAGIQSFHDFGCGFIQRLLVNGERLFDQRFKLARSDNFIEAIDGVAAAPSVPRENLVHLLARESVADKFLWGDVAFTQPMPAPAVAGISISRILESVSPQCVQNFVLDRFNRRWKIRN